MARAPPGSRSTRWSVRRTASGVSTAASSRGFLDVRSSALAMKKLVVALALCLCALADAPAQPTAITYPTKLVRIINPVAPGGNQDTIARAIAEQLTRALGQQVIVESRPGASATVGTRYVKGTPADGYTLLAISN